MDDLVTLDQLKNHLRLPLDGHDEDDDLELKLTMAHEIVGSYIKQRLDGATTWATEVDAWTDSTAPRAVLGAVLLQAGELYRFRGDDEKAPRDTGMLSPMILQMLSRYRDPALA